MLQGLSARYELVELFLSEISLNCIHTGEDRPQTRVGCTSAYRYDAEEAANHERI